MQDGPPSNKRLLLDDDVSLNMRMTPIGLPGANIKITSRGTYVARAKLWLETKREMVGNWVFKTNKQINKLSGGRERERDEYNRTTSSHFLFFDKV